MSVSEIDFSERTYDGAPEKSVVVDPSQALDINALHCALECASSVCKMFTANFDGITQDKFNDYIFLNACWALDGLLDQALIISLGKES